MIGLTNKLLKRYVEKHEKIARAEGELKGAKAENDKWITVLIEDNISEEDISRYSGLPIDKIRKRKLTVDN